FGSGYEVHSMLGDLWIRFGLAGAALLVTLLIIIGWGTAAQVARRQAGGIMIFLAIQVFWDSLFAPFFSTSSATLALAAALALVPWKEGRAARGDDSEFVSF